MVTLADSLLWTTEARACVLPRRRHGARQALPAGRVARDAIHAVYTLRRDAIVRGATHADSEHAPLQQKAIAHLDGDGPFVAVAAAAAAHLVQFELEPRPGLTGASLSGHFVDAWLEQGGAALAVLACATTTAVRARRDPGDRSLVLDRYVSLMQYGEPVREPAERRWTALRARLATMPDADYAAARDAAAKLLPGASPRLAARLVYAFPDETAWSAALARTLLAGSDHAHFDLVLASLADAQLVSEIIEHFHGGAYQLAPHVYDLADALQLDAAGALVAIAESAADVHWGVESERRESAAAVALVPTPEVAAWLAARLDDKAIRAPASQFFARAPRLAITTLAPVVAGPAGKKKTSHEHAAALLSSVVRAAPDEARAAAEQLTGPAGRLVLDLVARTAVVAEAEPSALPPVLAAPPWASGRPRSKKKKSKPIELAPLPFEEHLVEGTAQDYPAVIDETAALARIEKELAAGSHVFLFQLATVPRTTALSLLERHPASAWCKSYRFDQDLAVTLARVGIDALGSLLRFAKERPGEVAAGLEAAVSPRVAPIMAHVLTRLRKTRRVAERWLVRHPRAAALGLLPELVGKGSDAKARAHAARALRFLAARGKADVLAEVAARYGAPCAGALAEALTNDTLADSAPTRPPVLPSWLAVGSLPRPRLSGAPTRSLPLVAVQSLCEMLAFTDPEEPYEGLEQVRETCDAVSLGELGWGIFEAWCLAGNPMDEKWAFFAIGHLGRDDHAHRIAALVRQWPSDGAFPRAVLGLDVLATMKSDAAFMLLHGIAEKVKSRPLQQKAREKMESVAESLGLGTEELADRLVPTLGLDDDGSRVLDFGARSFRVGFDEHLRPFVRDAEGARLAELPKPGKSDDEAKAAASGAEWKAIKKAAKAAAGQQLERLQNAMIAQRRWEQAAFATYLVAHPLVTHLVRRLVFGAYDEGGALLTTFRVAEDGTYADPDDRALELPEGARVGVLHPLEISVAAVAAWGERLSEYEVLQPFPQVGREVPRSITRADVERFTPVDSLKLLGLERRGWRRGPVGDGGIVDQVEKEAGTLRVALQLEPGIYAGDPRLNPLQTPRSLAFSGEPGAIFLAEVAADLRAVGAVTSPA